MVGVLDYIVHQSKTIIILRMGAVGISRLVSAGQVGPCFDRELKMFATSDT